MRRSSLRFSDETPEGRSIVVLAKEKFGLRGRDMAPMHAHFVPFTAQTRMSGVDLDGQPDPQGRGRLGDRVPEAARRAETRPEIIEAKSIADRHRQVRRHAAGRRQGRPAARRHPSQGRGEGRHPRALRRTAPDGHPHRDDHRRQSADRRGDRRRGRRRRLPGPGDAGGQAAADPRGAGQRQAGRDVRRRHQRRAGPGTGRRRRRHADRHPGRARGRQHGRSRQQPDQAHRDRGDRQAAADDARLADHLLDRQRRGQVLRHHSGDVRGVLSRRSARSTSWACRRRRARSSARSSSMR